MTYEEEVRDALDRLEECLSDGNFEKRIDSYISNTIEASEPAIEVLRNLDDGLTNVEVDPDIVQLIKQVLINNNAKFYEQVLDIELPERCRDFFFSITRKYGIHIRKSFKQTYSPEEWRFVTSQLHREEFQGKRLYTKFINWRGEELEISADAGDTVCLAQHFVKNLTTKFESFDASEKQRILKELETLEANIEQLRDKVRDVEEEA